MGDRVREGAPLVYLDAEKLKYRLDEQQATLEQTRARLGAHGADVVYVAEHAGLSSFERESIAATVAERAKQGGYRAVVLGFSTQGRDLGPRLAAKLDAPIASDVTEISVAGDAMRTRQHHGPLGVVQLRADVMGSQ